MTNATRAITESAISFCIPLNPFIWFLPVSWNEVWSRSRVNYRDGASPFVVIAPGEG